MMTSNVLFCQTNIQTLLTDIQFTVTKDEHHCRLSFVRTQNK